MRKLIFLFLIIVTACSNPSSETFFPSKKFNNGNKYKWHNVFLEKIELPADIDTTGIRPFSFCTGAKYIEDVWGWGKAAEGIYPAEFLPSFFKRKIILKDFAPADGELCWIFTGEKGGFTITANNKTATLSQRFYNSQALNEQVGDTFFLRRYADKEIVFSAIQYSGKLQSITVECTSNNQLRMYLNGLQAAEQLFMQDMTQHQIRYTGKEGNICGVIVEPDVQTSAIKVNDEKTYQEIIGFGGITSIPAYNQLSEEGKTHWWNLLKDFNLLIQREYPNGSKLNEEGTNFDNLNHATPHYYGDNFPNGEISDFSYNKKIWDRGGMVIFEFWQLPKWAVIKDSQLPIYEKYAQAVISYCKQSLLKTGRVPEIIGVQNEVEQPDTVWQQMALTLRAALDKNGFEKIKIHMHNNSVLKGGIEAAHAFIAKKEVWETIDYSASNLYDYQQYKLNIDAYDTVIDKWNGITKGKPFISTELCQNDNLLQEQSYKTAFFMGQLYHKNMVMMDASVLMYCWLLVNTVQPSFQTSRSLFAIDMKNNFVPIPSSWQLRVLGSFSRKLSKGMKRIDAFTNDKDILVSAYKAGPKHTMIIMNRGTASRKINVDWPGMKIKHAELTNYYSHNKIVEITSSILIKPGDILTLFN